MSYPITRPSNTGNCGVRELYPVSRMEPRDIIQQVAKECSIYTYYIFSDVVSNDSKYGGETLKKYILENKLGEILETPTLPNRNHSPYNPIKVYVWMHNPEAILEFTKTKKETPKKVLTQNNYGDAQYIIDPQAQAPF